MGPPPKRKRLSNPSGCQKPSDGQAEQREELILPLSLDHHIDITDQPKLEIIDGRLTHVRERPSVAGDGQPLLQRRQGTDSADLTVVVASTVLVSVAVDAVGTPTGTITMPSVPSVPSVPAVPPFPSDLTVPSVPAFPTQPLPTVPAVPPVSTGSSVTGTVASTDTQQVLGSPPATPVPAGQSNSTVATEPTAATATTATPLSSASGSMLVSSQGATGSSSLTEANTIGRHSGSSSRTHHNTFVTAASSNSTSTSFSSTTTSTHLTTSTLLSGSSTILSSSRIGSSGTGAFGPGATGAGSGSAGNSGSGSSGGGSGGGNGSGNTPTPVIAGAVTGSVGAAAVLLIIVWLLLRWYRRRSTRPAALPGDDSVASLRPTSGNTPATSQRQTFLPGGAAALMGRMSRENRRSSPTVPSTPERGFQKIAGRKMPSQFDTDDHEGPMARDFEKERQARSTLSDASFYRDSYTSGASGGQGPSTYDPTTKEIMMPSPARTPVVHSGGPFAPDLANLPRTSRSTLSPPQTPRATEALTSLGRSHHDGSRGSRFTEEV